jgi:hypothetical protein
MDNPLLLFRSPLIWMAMLGIATPVVAQHVGQLDAPDLMQLDALGKQLAIGDIVFIRASVLPFEKVASTTNSWTNHVGIVMDVSGQEPLIAESRFPLSGVTTWSRFAARSENGRVAVSRLGIALDLQQLNRLRKAVADRSGILYDTGFDLHSRRQFCSRYVREVLDEATAIPIGQIENFSTLLAKNPQADLAFWRIWYFGYIPWQRETVTPASLLNDAKLHKVFDGHVSKAHPFKGN